MKILLIADEEDKYLWDHYRPGRLQGIDMILSAGDLKPDYLSFLVTMANRPLLYVHGNHDGIYEKRPPEGCQCVDGQLARVNGMRILGLGGSMLYSGGPHQYSDRQMTRRINWLRWKLKRSGGVDIVLAHAPARGYGDQEDLAHRGFESFLPLIDKYQPKYFVHGHVHQSYNAGRVPRVSRRGQTTIINCVGRFILDTEDPPIPTEEKILTR